MLALLQHGVRHYAPVVAGLALLSETGLGAVASFLAGPLLARLGPWAVPAAGLSAGGLGMGALALFARASYPVLGAALGVVGVGTFVAMSAMTSAVVGGAAGESVAIASALLQVSRQVESVLGAALLAARDSPLIYSAPGLSAAPGHPARALQSRSWRRRRRAPERLSGEGT